MTDTLKFETEILRSNIKFAEDYGHTGLTLRIRAIVKLSPALRKRIKAVGGKYGDARGLDAEVRSVTLPFPALGLAADILQLAWEYEQKFSMPKPITVIFEGRRHLQSAIVVQYTNGKLSTAFAGLRNAIEKAVRSGYLESAEDYEARRAREAKENEEHAKKEARERLFVKHGEELLEALKGLLEFSEKYGPRLTGGANYTDWSGHFEAADTVIKKIEG